MQMSWGFSKERLCEEGVAMQMRPHGDRAMYAKDAWQGKAGIFMQI